jgi:diaminopimelate epimerase
MSSSIDYTVYSALGNRFALVSSASPDPLDTWGKLATAITENEGRWSIDGLLVLRTQSETLARVDIFNRDGSPGGFSGNGLRCAALHLLDGAPDSDTVFIDMGSCTARAGRHDGEFPHTIEVRLKGVPCRSLVDAAERTDPTFLQKVTSNTLEGFWVVDVGNPHLLLLCSQQEGQCYDTVALDALRRDGTILPGGINVSVIRLGSERNLFVETFERGVGATASCASAAMAAFLTLREAGLLEGECVIEQSGGTLVFRQDDDFLLMVGSVTREGTGIYHGPRCEDEAQEAS